jgi:hypothetical protein
MFLIWFFAPAKRAPSALAIGEKVRARRQRLNRALDRHAMAAGISRPDVVAGGRSRFRHRRPRSRVLREHWNVPMEYFFEMPSEKHSAQRGDLLELFGCADSAHDRSTVPYGANDNESGEAAFVQVGAPRWFSSRECGTGRDARRLPACNFEDDEMIESNMPIRRI